MSTSWTRVASKICTEALQMVSAVEVGQNANPEDMQLALDALDAILKELPLYGYTWPKLSAKTALTWTGQTFTLPTDYFNYPVVWSNGRRLMALGFNDWNAIVDTAGTAELATHFYISPANVLSLYPSPTVDPVLTIQYQRIISDVVNSSAVDLPQFWIDPLGYGVANKLTLKFDTPIQKADRIKKEWVEGRTMALRNSVPDNPIYFGVVDDTESIPHFVPSPSNSVIDGGTP